MVLRFAVKKSARQSRAAGRNDTRFSFQDGALEPRSTWTSSDASCGPGCMGEFLVSVFRFLVPLPASETKVGTNTRETRKFVTE
jgi:hypothetical protein